MAFEREIVYRVRDAAFSRHADEMKRYLRESGTGLSGLVKKFGVLRVVMLGIAALGGAAIFKGLADAIRVGFRQAREFEDAMVGVRKTTGLVGAPLANLENGLIDLSKALGIAADELATYAEIAGQLGVRGNDAILTFTETAAKLANVSDLSAEDAANAVAKISRAFGIAVTQSERVGSVLNELSNTAAITAGQLADALSRVGTAGSAVGFTIDQVAGLATTLVENGIRARVAGTSLRNVFIGIQTQAGELAEQMGVTEESFRNLISDDAEAALLKYLEYLNTLDKQTRAIRIDEIFGAGNFLAVNTLAQSTARLAENTETAGDAFRENTSLSREYATQLDSFSGQLGLVQEKLAAVTRALGTRFLSAATRTLRVVNDMTASFDDLVTKTDQLAGTEQALRDWYDLTKRFDELKLTPDLDLAEMQELRRLTAELAEVYPQFAQVQRETGEAVDIFTDELRENLSVSLQQVEAQRELTRFRLAEKFLEAGEAIEKQTERTRDLRRQSVELYKTLDLSDEASRNFLGDLGSQSEEAQQELNEATASAAAMQKQILALYDTGTGFDTETLRSDLLLTTGSLEVTESVVERLEQAFIDMKLRATEGLAVAREFGQGLTGDFTGDKPPAEADDEQTEAEIEAQRQEAERLAEAYGRVEESVRRYQALLKGRSEQEKAAIGELLDTQQEIRRVEEARLEHVRRYGAESAEAYDVRLAQLSAEEGFLQNTLDSLGDLRRLAGEAAVPLNELGELINDFDTGDGVQSDLAASKLREIVDAQERYREALQETADQVALNEITAEQANEQRLAASRAYRAELQRVMDFLEALGLMTPELRTALAEAFREGADSADDAADATARVVEATRLIATSVRGVLRLADAFGDVDDNARRAIEGVADLAEGIGRIVSGDVVGGSIQAITGAVGALSGLFGGDSEQDRAEAEALRERLVENEQAIRENTDALREGAQRGTDLSSADIYNIQLAAQGLEYQSTLDFTNRLIDEEFISRLNARLQRLVDAGVPQELVDEYRERIQLLIEQGYERTEAMQEVLGGPDGFLAVLQEIIDTAGEYTDSVRGQIQQIRDQQQFLGVEGVEAVRSFIDSIIESTRVSRDGADILRQIADLNPEDFESQEDYLAAVDELIAEFYRLGIASGLSVEEMNALLSTVQNLAGGIDDVVYDLSRGEQIAQAIRELELALRFGAVTTEEAFQRLLDSVRPPEGSLGGNLLSGIINGIEKALDLEDTAGLEELINYMSGLTAEQLGITQEMYEALLAEMQELLDGLRDGIVGTLDFEAPNELLSGFLDQLAELDLDTEAGQQALDDIIAQLYELGALALGLTEEQFLALLGQLQSFGTLFEQDIRTLGDAFGDSLEYLRNALRFGAIEIEEAFDLLLEAIRNASEGGVLGTAEGGSLLEQFLMQIAALDLTTEEGQQQLADLIAQMFRLGADAFGIEQDLFLQILDQLLGLAGDFDIIVGNVLSEDTGLPDESGELGESVSASDSNAFRVSRQITEFQANEMLAVLRSMLYELRRIAAFPAPSPVQPSVPVPVAPMQVASVGSADRFGSGGARLPASEGEWVTVQLRRGDVDDLTRAVYPGIVRRMGSELRRTVKR